MTLSEKKFPQTPHPTSNPFPLSVFLLFIFFLSLSFFFLTFLSTLYDFLRCSFRSVSKERVSLLSSLSLKYKPHTRANIKYIIIATQITSLQNKTPKRRKKTTLNLNKTPNLSEKKGKTAAAQVFRAQNAVRFALFRVLLPLSRAFLVKVDSC